ncbi:NAD(P)-binding oxidoreductase [Streptomyces griseorubiginosus]|uniref:NAD(P)-dependent oxidoreductase n=1 Tax=Streptomyces griseorubiginosus TaxID=67304 RepID=UPI002E809C36|nr:NAD(P)-binding oxidoreductase [Streptomyces griseorubiginosus]WUB49515.1 SDR family oxidoreductase [Streptomyces griseorubiginosus]WUB58044.1 SDR family oxidoreductase [Streptomyces griseorubiginosus]
MSNFLVLGGSGRTGAHVLEHAARRGHHVRALVRNPDKVRAPAGVELIQGTPANIDDLRKAAEGTDAVISALNNSRTSDNPWAKPVSPPMFMTDATRNTLTVMGEQGIPRIVLTSTQGAGDDWARLNPLVKAFINRSNIKAGFEDHTGVDQLVRASSGIDWTLARAVTLTDKPLSGPVRAAEAGTEKPGARINRADLAQFLVQTVEDDAWIRRAPLVWNTRGAGAAPGEQRGRGSA